ncbi:MAG: hypothetical protein ACLTAN_06880, partial [Christensenellaceae bacterium]
YFNQVAQLVRPSLAFPFGESGAKRRERSPCVFLKNRQSGGKNFLAAALIFNRCFRYSSNR